MKNCHLPLLFLLLFPGYLIAGVLKGKVTDDKGAKLPYATIYVEGTTIGVNANGNGDFELTMAPGLYKVVCQYIGYKQSSYNLSFTGDETIEHTFVLKDQSLEMKEVVVHANSEDPAYAIIRNAIKKRKYHLEQVRSFQTSIYLKGVIRSRKLPEKFLGQKVKDEETVVDTAGKGVLYLTEEDADYYSRDGEQKTVIHTVHESGNKSGLGFSRLPHVITFYDNNVNLIGSQTRGFISPVSDNALLYYRYKLLGEFKEQGNTIYKIRVIQKRAFEPCFNGDIYIVDGEWAIHSLNLLLLKTSGMDVFDTMRVDQLFLPINNDNWVIKSQVQYFTINMFGFDATANFVTVYNNQKVNEPIPDSVFAGKVVSSYDKTATKKDTAYWHEARPIPLEKDEIHDFIVKDSLFQKLTSPEHLDSMRRKDNKLKPIKLLTDGYFYATKKFKNTFKLNSLLLGLSTDNMVNYNIVEGFNLAPKIHWQHLVDTGKYLIGDAAVRYGFNNTHFNAVGRLYYLLRDRAFLNRAWLFGVEGGKYVYQYNPENPVIPWYNTYSDLFSRQNDLKIYERTEVTGFLRRNYGDGVSWSLKASYQQRLPLQNTTNFSFIKGGYDGYTSNTPPHLLATATAWERHEAALIFASVSYKPGITFTEYPDYKMANVSNWPRLTVNYDKGIPGILNSKSDFDKWRVSVADEVDLKLLGEIKYNFAVGGFLNTTYVAIPDLMHLYGNRGIGLASPYLESFQFAQYYDFSNKERLYWEGHAEYHLKGLISNKIPLLRQARYYLLFGGNAFYASPTDFYTEAFVGIDNVGWKLVRLLRIDFVQSWDSYKGSNSGIRLGINIPGISSPRNNPTQSEW
jgi:hypothetical protein